MAAPMDANVRGRVGVGRMLEWIDKSAYACAAAWSGHYCVTAYVGNVRFHQPLHVGDLVEVQARLIHTGTSSVHVSARVRSGNPRTGELNLTTECTMVLVGLDTDGHKRAVPPRMPTLSEDVALDTHAQTMVEIRARLLRAIPLEVPPLVD